MERSDHVLPAACLALPQRISSCLNLIQMQPAVSAAPRYFCAEAATAYSENVKHELHAFTASEQLKTPWITSIFECSVLSLKRTSQNMLNSGTELG